MSKPSYICNCDVIHEDIVNDVKSKMQPKDDYIQLASLFKYYLEMVPEYKSYTLWNRVRCVYVILLCYWG